MSSKDSAPLSYPLGDHLVLVDCDAVTGRITIARPRLRLQQGENVIWSFRGVPEGWTPLLIFDLGVHIPFAAVTQSPLVSWGVGAKPTAVPVRYRVALQRGAPFHLWQEGGVLEFSAPASLHVEEVKPLKLLPPVVFNVKRKPRAKPEAALVVEPASQQVRTGQTVEWRFDKSCFPDGKPDSWQSSVLFTRFEGEPGKQAPDLAYGPFDMVSTSPGRVIGAGNNDVVGFYHFQVLVLSLEHGDIVYAGSGDPSVDNRDGVDGDD